MPCREKKRRICKKRTVEKEKKRKRKGKDPIEDFLTKSLMRKWRITDRRDPAEKGGEEQKEGKEKEH